MSEHMDEKAHVWVVMAHGAGVDRICDSLDTARAVCEDALATLGTHPPVVENWGCIAADGESIWVRYYRSQRWVNGRMSDAVIEQRVTRYPVDATGKWFPVAMSTPPGTTTGGDDVA